jgi:hypothetical protein
LKPGSVTTTRLPPSVALGYQPGKFSAIQVLRPQLRPAKSEALSGAQYLQTTLLPQMSHHGQRTLKAPAGNRLPCSMALLLMHDLSGAQLPNLPRSPVDRQEGAAVTEPWWALSLWKVLLSTPSAPVFSWLHLGSLTRQSQSSRKQGNSQGLALTSLSLYFHSESFNPTSLVKTECLCLFDNTPLNPKAGLGGRAFGMIRS